MGAFSFSKNGVYFGVYRRKLKSFYIDVCESKEQSRLLALLFFCFVFFLQFLNRFGCGSLKKSFHGCGCFCFC